MEKLINEISSQWDSWIGDYGVERLSDRQVEIQSRVDRGEHFTVKYGQLFLLETQGKF